MKRFIANLLTFYLTTSVMFLVPIGYDKFILRLPVDGVLGSYAGASILVFIVALPLTSISLLTIYYILESWPRKFPSLLSIFLSSFLSASTLFVFDSLKLFPLQGIPLVLAIYISLPALIIFLDGLRKS